MFTIGGILIKLMGLPYYLNIGVCIGFHATNVPLIESKMIWVGKGP